MCDFFSHIQTTDGRLLYLTDDIIEAWRGADTHYMLNNIGHFSIEDYFNESGEHLEGILTVPTEVVPLINSGKMRKMMQAGGYSNLKYNVDGTLREVNGKEWIHDIPARENTLDGLRVGHHVKLQAHSLLPNGEREYWNKEMYTLLKGIHTISNLGLKNQYGKYIVGLRDVFYVWQAENLILLD